jgi:hypothetical protein
MAAENGMVSRPVSSADGDWSDWFSLDAPPSSLPSQSTQAPIAAVARKPEHLNLWVTSNDGQGWSTYWDVASGWHGWVAL